jgi:putative ABC transport system permease protein
MDYHFEKISHEDIIFSIRDPKGKDASGEMARLPLVAYSESQLNVVCDLKNGPYSKRTGITGLPRRGRLYTPLDEKGNRIVIPDEGLILTGKLAEILRVKKGDEIRIRPLIAQRREVNAAVVGISHTFLGLSVYCGKGFLSHLLGEELVANTYFTDTFRDKPLHDLMVALKKRPAVIGLNERRRTLDQMRETMGKFMGSFFVIMIIFAGIIAFGALLNTAMVSLSERQREVGALRVIGYTTSEVWRIFAGEGLILNSVGIFLGVWLGVGLSFLISIGYNTELYRFPVVIYPSRVGLTIVIMLIFLALAQAVVYRMIHNLAWLDSLKVKE